MNKIDVEKNIFYLIYSLIIVLSGIVIIFKLFTKK